MILPICLIGNSILRKKATDIDKNYPNLAQLITDMFETMYHTDGVGLAAPQIGKSIRLFVIDGDVMNEDYPDLKDFKRIFINAYLVEEEGEEWSFNEGCLSIPGIREDVKRLTKFRLKYYDENWEFHDEIFDGGRARIMQHEYDHLEGILFTDKISPIRRKLINPKLVSIAKGKTFPKYKFVPNK
jgi:peptide deformylase